MARRQAIVELNSGKVFDTLSEAGRFYGINTGNISAVCQKTRKQVAGLRFAYLDSDEGREAATEAAKKKCFIERFGNG